MTNISCSILELVKQDPIGFVQSLGNGSFQKGGTHGMFAYWQDTAKRMHQEGLSISEALKELNSIYRRRFEENPRNERKQELLYSSLVNYEKAYKSLRLSLHEGRKRMQWPLIPQIQLTGLTPLVFKRSNEYFGYFYSEKYFTWQMELKYPLLQSYIAKQIVGCHLKSLHIGLYFLENNSFESRNYTLGQVKDAIVETTGIFEKVNTEMSRRRIIQKNK